MEKRGGAGETGGGWRQGVETSRCACSPLSSTFPVFILLYLRAKATKKAATSSTVSSSTPITPTGPASGSKASENRSAKSDGIKIDHTGDKTRDKCVELVYDALVFDSGARTSSP